MPESRKYLPGGNIRAGPPQDHERTEADGESKQGTGMPEASGHFHTKAPIPLRVPTGRVKLKLHDEEKRCVQAKPKEIGAWSWLSDEDTGRRRMPWHPADHAEKLRNETERRRAAENRLHESEESFRLALDTSFNGVWDLNLVTGEINFGNNWYRILGYDNCSEIPDRKSWQSLIHPSDLEKILDMHNALAHGASSQCEAEYRIKDRTGAWLWILSRGRVLTRDEKGNVLRIIGIDTDITRLKQTESELKTAGAELEQQLLARTTELQSTKIALDVLLRKRETDRADLEESVMHNIDRLVEPILARLEESRLTAQQRELLGLLRENINELTSPFAETFSTQLSRLTPSEIRIANLVKLGKRTKEIANILNLSEGTICIHRRNIRKKLQLTHKKNNLQTVLASGRARKDPVLVSGYPTQDQSADGTTTK